MGHDFPQPVRPAGRHCRRPEGLVDHARDVQGTERRLAVPGDLRWRHQGVLAPTVMSTVNAIARQFGGGGHIKASGAVVRLCDGGVAKVLAATRAALRELDVGPGRSDRSVRARSGSA